MSDLELVGCWALTEPSNGSDASALLTTATRAPGGWHLNGRKRWIGNATFADIAVIWARNAQTGQVTALTACDLSNRSHVYVFPLVLCRLFYVSTQ